MKSSALFFVVLTACSSDLPRISQVASYWRVGISDLIEGKRSIQGRISHDPIESGVVPSVRIRTASGREVIALWEESIDPKITIDRTNEYTIELLTTIGKQPDMERNTVLRVYSDEGDLVDASVCYMHKIPMRRVIEEEVALEDYWPYKKQYFKGNNYTPRLFPNDGKSYLGCAVGPEWTTWQCPKCFEMSEEWKRQHEIE